MPLFVLDVDVMAAQRALSFRLSDEHGRHLGANQVALADQPVKLWEGLFDTRSYVRRFAGVLRAEGRQSPMAAPELVEQLGVFLGQHVLGPTITGALASGIQQRTLVVRLQDPAADPLVAALARVPWEIARPAHGDQGEAKPLMARNVVVRVVPAGVPPSAAQVAIELGPSESLRVLLVYAEAPDSRPLAARLERERLLSLFISEVMPKRRVTVDVLCHGVTRERLRERIQDAGGYHIVHWSGHGRHDELELEVEAGEGGRPAEGIAPGKDVLRGAELVDLFARAGGFVPQLFFLSACHSGSFVGVKDWAALQAWLRDPSGGERGLRATPSIGGLLVERKGHTGTALELLQAGVPQVVAMRYEVGDAYARELALHFYRGLVAQQRSHAADAALAMARSELTQGGGGAPHHPVDHATPVLFGEAPIRFEPALKRSPQLDRLRPKPQPLLRGDRSELDPKPTFVGRGGDLAVISSSWLAPDRAFLAWIEGPEGIGKTALAAEIVHLWHERFDFVLAFQPEDAAPALDSFYKHIDSRMTRASSVYRERCRGNELAKIDIEPGGEIEGEARLELSRDNLVDAMLSERILLIVDGATADPAWERLLSTLSKRLTGSGSRVLVTSRHSAGLAGAKAVRVSLGPLSAPEATLFFEGSRSLRDLLYGAAEEQALARRILDASRGHPMILERLGELAAEGGAALEGALARIEQLSREGLPDAFKATRTDEERKASRRYFDAIRGQLGPASPA